MKHFRLKNGLTALLLAGTAFNAAPVAAQNSDTLVIARSMDVNSLDPARAFCDTCQFYLTAVYETLLTLAAVAVILLPRRIAPFCALLAIQLVEIMYRAPVVSNHWWMSGVISLTLLGTLVASAPGGFSYQRWRRRFVSPLRAITLIVYFFGVFHKVNADFLDPEISCGVDLYRTLAGTYLTFLPQGAAASWFSIVGTLVVESAIPLLLIFKRTRLWGVILGVAFHYFLGFVPYSVYYNFSSALFALFWLWLEPDDHERVARRDSIYARLCAWRWPLTFLFLVFLAVGSTKMGGGKALWRHLYRIPWSVYGACCLWIAVAALRERRHTEPSVTTAHPPVYWTLVFPLLFMINGASPYLGLKTETSLAMYSNLRTEGGSSNHLIVRKTLDPFDRTQDIVTIVRSNDRLLRRLKKRRKGMLWFEFRDHLARRPKAMVVYELDGKRERIARAGDDPRFARREPWWIRKFVYFRSVDLDPRKRCSH